LRANRQIRAQSVRLIDENGKQVGVVSIREAQLLAVERDLDLVEVAPQAKPPVCKIMDFGKYRYQLQMKDRESKKKQHVVKLKEVRFRPRIGEHDLNMKVNHAKKFLEDGFKVKITLMFRGWELAHREVGRNLVDNIIGKLADFGTIEKGPIDEGRNIIAFLSSK